MQWNLNVFWNTKSPCICDAGAELLIQERSVQTPSKTVSICLPELSGV